MAAGAYSKQFILGLGIGPKTYTPPPGKSAVLKCLTAMNGTAGAIGATVDIAGIYIWYGSIPGTQTLVVSGLHIVIKPGQVLKMEAALTGCHLQASGYELIA